MKLYYFKGACSFAVRIVIHEIGLNCEFVAVDMKNKDAKKTETGVDFLTINPKGAVPVIELDNGAILTENAVIQQYLADQNKAIQLLPEVGDFKRYRVLEWLNYVSTELHKGFSPIFNPKVPEDTKKMFIDLIKHKFSYVDSQLQNNKFLAGDHFTLPDAYLFVILLWAGNFKIDIKNWPNLSRYYEEMKQRPSIQQAFQEEGFKK